MTTAFMSVALIREAYGLDPEYSFEDQFSKVSFENIIFELFAYIHLFLELLFDQHKLENENLIRSQKTHKAPDVRNRLLSFQYGFDIILDQWQNGNATDEQIEQSRIIKYAAVVESSDEKRVICKIATETDGELSPITETQLEAVMVYVKEIKPPGVPYTVINYLPDLLQLSIRIFRDPLVLDGNGVHRVTGLKPVEIALKEFMKELPFNGELRADDMFNKLKAIEGVELVKIDDLQSAWLNPATGNYGVFTSIDVRRIPESGYFKIVDFNGITYGI